MNNDIFSDITTKQYKCDYGLTGLFTTNYHKIGDYYMGVKVLFFITNCPNRYYAKKAVNYLLKYSINCYGWNREYFDNCKDTKMPQTKIIPFSDIAFGIGHKK